MSDSIAFALVGGTFLFGTFLSFWLSKVAAVRGNDVAIGARHGHSVPMSHRWLVLYTQFVTWALGAVGVSVFTAFANLLIARNVGGEDARLLAYLAAFLHSCVVLSWATMGPIHLVHYRRVLRKAEAEAEAH